MAAEKLLKDYSDEEKGAYLGAISSLATADRSATEEELEYIRELSASADLTPQQQGYVVRAANELSGGELQRCLDILKNSDLKFSLITDLISFAESDQNYSEAEKTNVEKIAQYLGVNQQQFSLLDQFVKKTSEVQATPEEVKKPGFLESLGLEEKMRSAGINSSTLMKTLLGIAGPLLLASMFNRRRGMGYAGGMGGMGGGMPGGGMLGSGGIGSVISMLNGGRGGFGSTGGLLGRMLGGRRGW